MKLTRREVSLGLGAAVACRPSLPYGGPFPLGVAAGDPTPDGALLWAHYTGDEALSLEVTDPGGVTTTRAVPKGLHPMVEITGLAPATRYRYAFVTAGGEREEGRFRTAPAAGTSPVIRLGATSCTKQGYDLGILSRAAERDDLDAFLFLGDTIYADSARDLEAYRAEWFEGLTSPDQQRLRASTGIVATWDDHEVANNWGGDNLPKGRIDAARQAFFEHMPVRQSNGAGRLWRSLRFGDTCEVFALDCRSERSGDDYMSDAQLSWFEAALLASPARFKVIMSSVPIARYAVPFFSPFADDRWEGFPRSRDRVLQHIASNGIGGVLWVGGDFHLACAGRLELEGPGKDQYEVLVGPGGQIPNVSPSYPAGPQFDWSSGVNNYAELELDPARGTIRVRWFDKSGRAFNTREI